MDVVHAAWGVDRRLHLWAEDRAAYEAATGETAAHEPADFPDVGLRRHPFAAATFVVPTLDAEPRRYETVGGEIELQLPTNGQVPLPSPELALGSRTGERSSPVDWARWSVPSAAHDPAKALSLLLSIPDRTEPACGASLRFLSRVALLAVELVARGRFVPSPARDDDAWRAVWRPALGAGDIGRVAAFASSMPLACLSALADFREGPDRRLETVTSVITALVDALVREHVSLAELPRGASAAVRVFTGRDRPFPADETEETAAISEALERWATAVQPTEGPFRTLFRLREPGRPEPSAAETTDTAADHADDVSQDWRLEVLVGARDDPSLILPAAQVWNDPRPLRASAKADPEEALLVDLARASRLYPPLEAALQTATPGDLELDTDTAHTFLRDGAPLLADAGYTVLLPAWWRQRRRRLGLRLRVRADRPSPARTGVEPGLGAETLVDYDWRVAVGNVELTEAELAALAHIKSGLVRIRGEWVEVEAGDIASALQAVEGPAGGGARPALTIADVLRTALGIAPAPGGLEVIGLEAEGWLGTLLGGEAVARPEPIPTPPGFSGSLRPYQERGLGWLAFLDRLGFGGILADDMGLGKTPQLLALLVAEQSNVPPAERLAPTLIVCPMSLVGNWQHEAARFAPTLRAHIHHGAGRLGTGELAEALRDVDLVITTYAILARDREALADVPWRRIVLDEAQEIKNAETDQSRAARSFRASSRFALTGTPIENRLTELWTIMDFANPGLLGPEETFRKRFSIPIERWNDDDAAERLRRLTAPFVLRRVKSDKSIAPELPEKIEFAVSCNLTREQASLYQAVVDELLPDIEHEQDEQAYRGKVLRAILRLKQVCNHPALFLSDGSRLRGRSGKLERLEEILDTILAAGERALVFTQFTEWADRLVPYLQDRFGREVLYLHGAMPRKARDATVERFGRGSAPIFVLSLKAGGKGLNLVAANHVIHYDRWWNPAVEDQASDRAYRIGQTRDVQVRTFVATGTLEEKIADMLAAKRDLAARVVRAGERAFTELTTAELRAVLALGADAVAEDAR